MTSERLTDAEAADTAPRSMRRISFASFVGTAIVAALVFPTVFFPEMSSTLAAMPPLVAGALLAEYGSWAIGLMMAVLILISLLSTYGLPETKAKAL